jgi:flagellin-like protein
MTKTKKRNEDAVSPVIGVIMMVAVTVILAAIIASYVFGMAGSMQSSKTVGTTLTQSSGGIGVLTIQGGASLPQVVNITYTLNGNTATELVPTVTAPVTVGRIYNTSPNTVAGKRVIIVGTFSDGSTSILQDIQF